MIQIGQNYTITRHGVTTTVIVDKIKGDKVTLKYPNRKDTFKIHINEFNKFYELVK